MLKNLMSAMDKYGDGEEELDNFNPEEFFNFNKSEKKEDTYSNPFNIKTEEGKSLTEKTEEPKPESKSEVNNENSKSDDLDIFKFDSTDTTDSDNTELELDDLNLEEDDLFKDEISIEHDDELDSLSLDVLEISENIEDEDSRIFSTRSRLDAIIEEDNSNDSIEISITQETVLTEESPEITNIKTIEEQTLTIEHSESQITLSEDATDNSLDVVEDDFSELAKISVVKDSNEIAKTFETNADNSIVITDGVQFKIDDDEDTVDESINLDYSNTNEEQFSNTFQQEEQYYNHESNTTNQTPLAEPQSQFPLYDTPFGKKYRVETKPVTKDVMINLKNFEDKKEVTGDVYIENASVFKYGDNKKRIEYNFVIADGAKIKGTKFNIPNDITTEMLEPLCNKAYKITGKWNLYNSSQNIIVDTMIDTEDTVPSDYVVNKTFDVYDNMFNSLTGLIKRDWLKELLDRILIGDGYLEKMRNSSAALSNHDTGKGDLFRHSVKIAMLANSNSILYPNVDSDVVIVSALLHDIGKVHEITTSTYTMVGITVGHISIAYNYVREKITELQKDGLAVEDNVALNILHCILAHHGKLEYGSPVTPKTREAVIVHMSDMLDAQVTHIDETLMGKGNRAFSKMFRHDVIDLNI